MNTTRINFHTHTKRCKHAGGTEEDYVKEAISCGFSMLGISDHAPFPDYDFGLRMEYEELDEYLNEIDLLKNRYDGQITLYKGLEIEYMPKYLSYYEELLGTKKLDYLLLGEHIYQAGDGTVQNIYFAPDTGWYISYANAIAEGLHTGLFPMVAHPDLFLLNQYAWDTNCDRAVDTILNAAAANNTILEYNANGLRRGITSFPDGERYPYPHEKFWTAVAAAKLPVIVGSDCHNPDNLWDDAVETAYRNLKELGIHPVVPASAG